MEPLSTVSCATCGVTFIPTRAWGKYCSTACRVNSPAKRARTRDYQSFRREWLNTIKVDIGCAICGYNKHPAALDFDHRDPSTKSFNISQDPKRSLQSILDEIAKCDVLCANCHRIQTYDKQHYHTARLGNTRA